MGIRKIRSTLLILFLLLSPTAFNGQQLVTRTTPNPVVNLTLPNREGSVRMLVFGDAGRGSKEQHELGALMDRYHQSFQYDTVLMTGDNIYYEDTPADMKKKFEDPYKALLDKSVKFYASLGNHDSPNQRLYALFNMNGEEYYRIEKGGVAIYALNSVYMDKRQLDWFQAQLAKETAPWRIAFFHHPPFSSGKRHGSDEDLRKVLHPVLLSGGIDVVFTGHDHFYERIRPQDGIQYFVAGAAGKIRKGDIRKNSPLTEKGYDADLSFMLTEIVGDEMHFQVIARNGATVDSGIIRRRD
jgi:predicted phosphodiesterase